MFKSILEDGLYQVIYKDLCAGFEIVNGKVIIIAPILKRKFPYWESIANRIR